MRNSLVILLFSSVMFAFITGLSAQSNRVKDATSVTKTDLKELLEQLDLSKTRKKLVPRNEIDDSEENTEAVAKPSSYGLSKSTTILIYVIILVLVLSILYLVFSNNSEEETDEAAVPIYQEELEDIKELDVDSALEEAIQSGDFRGAIRFQFLRVLKILNERDYILWSQEKTNRQYLQEIKDTAFYEEVKILTQVFENAWYGNYRIAKSEFDQVVLLFNAFHKYNI